jgi:hypothetical protein
MSRRRSEKRIGYRRLSPPPGGRQILDASRSFRTDEIGVDQQHTRARGNTCPSTLWILGVSGEGARARWCIGFDEVAADQLEWPHRIAGPEHVSLRPASFSDDAIEYAGALGLFGIENAAHANSGSGLELAQDRFREDLIHRCINHYFAIVTPRTCNEAPGNEEQPRT